MEAWKLPGNHFEKNMLNLTYRLSPPVPLRVFSHFRAQLSKVCPSIGRVVDVQSSYSIIFRCRRSFNVRIGLDNASCPGQSSAPSFLVIFWSQFAIYSISALSRPNLLLYTGRFQAKFGVHVEEIIEKPNAVATRSRLRSLFDAWGLCTPRCSGWLLSPYPTLRSS